MFHVILLEPEIPPNTGNAIRLCANTGCTLHLIEPLGFRLEDRLLRRAGLDYHEYAETRVHPSLEACTHSLGNPRLFCISTRGTTRHTDQAFRPGDAFLFGAESRGLPDRVLAAVPPEHRIRLPMRPGMRSLNLSNAVAVVVFEAWRQAGFDGAV